MKALRKGWWTWDRAQRRRVRRLLVAIGVLETLVAGATLIPTSTAVRHWVSDLRNWCKCADCTPLAPDQIRLPVGGWFDYKQFLACMFAVGVLEIAVGLAISATPVRRPERCPKCRYDLRGAPTSVCPECGADASEAEEAASR